MMHSLPEGYRALVIGASGAIGSALVQQLQSDPRCASVLGVSRQSMPGLDLLSEPSRPARRRWQRKGRFIWCWTPRAP